jgi:hypothetical protein
VEISPNNKDNITADIKDNENMKEESRRFKKHEILIYKEEVTKSTKFSSQQIC